MEFTNYNLMIFRHGRSAQEKQAIIDGGNLSYVWITATHMLSGYDHEQKAISSEKVSVKVIEKVKQLVEKNKIDISWDGIK
ncbi:MAG: hypothetical protein ACPG9K_00145 [Poseidonibacter sp.]